MPDFFSDAPIGSDHYEICFHDLLHSDAFAP